VSGWILLATLIGMALALWLMYGPDRPPRPRPAKTVERIATVEEVVTSFAQLANGMRPLNVMSATHEHACEDCHGRRLVWTRDPARHDAWLGLCRRCGKVRLDVAQGQTLAL